MNPTINIYVNSDGSGGPEQVRALIYSFVEPALDAPFAVAPQNIIDIAVKVLVPYPPASGRQYWLTAQSSKCDDEVCTSVAYPTVALNGPGTDTVPATVGHKILSGTLRIRRPSAALFPAPRAAPRGR